MIAPPLETDERQIPPPAALRDKSLDLPKQAAADDKPASQDDEVFVFPATLAQRRFWLLHQMMPGGNPSLNMSVVMRLRGQLDARVLESAFNEVISRHESLRTVFHTEDGELCQIISAELRLRLAVVDPQDFPSDARAGVPDHLLIEEVETPFDLERGPLIRARLVRLTPNEHLLLVTTHHIVCDGWSNGVLLGELREIYAAFSKGLHSPLPDLPLQFADFAQWQHDNLHSGGLDVQLAYWRQQLRALPLCLDLPLDHPRKPARGVVSGGLRWRPLSETVATALKGVGQRHGASAYMLSLTAFATLLHRYTGGQEDIVVSSPSAGRARSELEGMIGLFAGPLLLRLDLSGKPTFGELLARVRKTVLDAFANSDVPFERLLEENLGLRRLQVNFLHQKAFVQPGSAAGIEWIPERPASGGATMDWTAGIEERSEGTQLFIDYNSDVFGAASMDCVLCDFETLLATVATEGGLEVQIGSAALSSVVESKTVSLLGSRWHKSAASLAWMQAACVGADKQILTTDGPGQVLGTVREGIRLFVLDKRLQPTPRGVTGEIYVAGLEPGAQFPDDSFVESASAKRERLFKTCDAGRVAANSNIEFSGSVNEQFICNGARVNITAMEAVLRKHSKISDVVVLSRPLKGREAGELVAYIVPAAMASNELTTGECRNLLRTQFTGDEIPADFVIVEAFPLTLDGLLDAAALPSPATTHDPQEKDGTPFLTIHHQLIEIWQEVLGIQGIGTRDDFFALGGNSLLAMRMLSLIERNYGKTLQPATLFKQATVEYLAEEMIRQDAGANNGKGLPVVAIQEKGNQTPIFYLHGDLTGGGYYCMKLAAGLGADRPFYALPPVDISGYQEHLPSIEEMAETHIKAIQEVRSHGPYIIGGFCLGGLVAYEVARQLKAAGETVEKLVIIDANATSDRLKYLRRFADWRGRRNNLDNISRLHVFCKGHYFLARLERWKGLKWSEQREIARRRLGEVWSRVAGRVSGKLPARPTPPPTPLSAATAESLSADVTRDGTSSWFNPRWDVPLVFLWAAGGYTIKPYAGSLALFLSSDVNEGGDSKLVRDWKLAAHDTQMYELPGSHLACITKHVGDLAATIRKVLAA